MASQGVSNSSFVFRDDFKFYSVNYPHYEKRVSSDYSKDEPLTNITVHFQALSDEEKATGIIKNVKCAFSRQCWKSENENWHDIDINVSVGLKNYYHDKGVEPLEFITTVWNFTQGLKSRINELESKLEWINDASKNSSFSMESPFYCSPNVEISLPGYEGRIYFRYGAKSSSPEKIIVNFDKLSEMEKKEGILDVAVYETHKKYQSPLLMHKDLDIKAELDRFERAKNPELLLEDTTALQNEIDEMKADLARYEKRLESNFA